jgi:hypothetical protein
MLNSNATFIIVGRRYAVLSLEPTVFAQIYFHLEENKVESNELTDLASDSSFQDFTAGISDLTIDYNTKGCLFELFVQLQGLNCSYERDIISISLNASGIRLSFNGDVKNQQECRYTLAMIALGAGDASEARAHQRE